MKRMQVACVMFLLVATFGVARGDQTYTITPDIVYGHKAGLALTFDMIRPNKQNGAAVMFIVSGAWRSGWIPPESFMSSEAPFDLQQIGELVNAGYTLFIVRHGSAPLFKVPDAVSDVRRAARLVHRNAEDFGIDAERIGVFGASAGGHLSLMLGTTGDDGDPEAQDELARTGNRIRAVVAYCPPVDLREWVGDERFPALEFDPALAESVSPLLHVTSDDAATLLIHGDQDQLVTLDNSERILAAFEQHEVPSKLVVVEGAGHRIERDSAVLVEWFDQHLAPQGSGAALEPAGVAE